MAASPTPRTDSFGDAFRRPGRPLLAGLAVLALGLYFSANTGELERRRQVSEQRAAVQSQLSDFRARLETEVYASLALARGLAAQLVIHEGMDEADFQAIAAELVAERPQILRLSLAPDFVEQAVYPPSERAATLGLNLIDDPQMRPAVLRSISKGDTVLAGPFPRRDGRAELVGRIPLWVEREGAPRLWGAVSVALDYDWLLEDAGILTLEKALEVGIVGRDAAGPGGELVRGERMGKAREAVKVPVFLPGGSWLISAVPREGWSSRPWYRNNSGRLRLLLSVLAALATTRILQDRKRIRRLAASDALTDLPNRRWALQQLERMIARGRRDGSAFALLSFDLDGFKPVNDTYGHAAGDLLLAEIGRRVRDSVRPGDRVARMGGDEFLVLMRIDPGDASDWLRAAARRIQAAVSRPHAIEGHWLVVGASIGIACFPRDADQAEALLRLADEAMYRAKAGEGEGLCFARPPGPARAPD